MSTTESSLSQVVKDLQASLVLSQRLDLQAKQIRILHLLPGEEDDPIRCELYTAYLGDQPYYEALSYVWGNAKIVKPIFLGGRQVQVTTNLEAALRALRLREETRRMWVDALCINQTDDVEKTHQVNLMAEIYKATALCLIWLGRLDAGPDLMNNDEGAGTSISPLDAFNAFDLIKRIAEAGEDEHFSCGNLPSQCGTIQVTMVSSEALRNLVFLDWWYRMWTLQEVVLPRKATVFCGCLKLDWSVFLEALKTMRCHNEKCCLGELASIQQGHIVYGLMILKGTLTNFGIFDRPRLDITDVLWATHNRETGDSRDRFYALLGLNTRWKSQFSAMVDYSLPPREVFRRMTTDLILLSNNLKPLIKTGEPSTDALLPTWVHDLSAPWHDYTKNLNTYDSYNASGGKELSVQFSPGGEFRSRGVLVDEVERIGDIAYFFVWDGMLHKLEHDDTWVDMLDLDDLNQQGRPYPTGGSYLDAFMRLVRNESDPDTCANQHDFSVRNWLGTVNLDNINKFATNTRLFVTKKGLIGLGPEYMQVGDTVHVLFGGNVPFVLRPIKEGGHKRSYTYVTHCYVQGIMEGYAVQSVGDGEWFTLI